ncbi:MAG: hypothetical protein GY730_05015 [bacterium]|nr:hypothetical protein [bacterium]
MKIISKHLIFVFLFAALFLANEKNLFSKENLNNTSAIELPDISLVGNILGTFGSDDHLKNNKKLVVEETELAIQGYLYPAIRMDVIMSLHRHDSTYQAELEEAYVSFLELYLPGAGIHIPDLSVKAGKKLLDIGKINAVHPHHWNYVTRPDVLNSFFGEHGLSGQGLSFSYLLPAPFFCQWDIGAWYIDSADSHDDEEHSENENVDGMSHYNYLTRLWTSFELSQDQELETGLNAITGYGSHYQEHKDRITVTGFDITYEKFISSYQKLFFQNEVYMLKRELPEGTFNRSGFYSFLNYRMNKYWDCGLRYDYVEAPSTDTIIMSHLSAIVTHSLTEMTKARIQYTKSLRDSDYAIYCQLTFGTGPHSHTLE